MAWSAPAATTSARVCGWAGWTCGCRCRWYQEKSAVTGSAGCFEGRNESGTVQKSKVDVFGVSVDTGMYDEIMLEVSERLCYDKGQGVTSKRCSTSPFSSPGIPRLAIYICAFVLLVCFKTLHVHLRGLYALYISSTNPGSSMSLTNSTLATSFNSTSPFTTLSP